MQLHTQYSLTQVNLYTVTNITLEQHNAVSVLIRAQSVSQFSFFSVFTQHKKSVKTAATFVLQRTEKIFLAFQIVLLDGERWCASALQTVTD